MKFQTYLNELFDTQVPIKIEWQELSDLRYSFVIDGKKYEFDADNEKGSWEIVFTYRGDKASTGITGTGNAAQVFSAVAKCIDMFLKKYKPNQFWFSAKEPSRKKLYDKFSKLITRKYPYVLENKKVFDDRVYIFTRK